MFQQRIYPSEYPAKRFIPSCDHDNDKHFGLFVDAGIDPSPSTNSCACNLRSTIGLSLDVPNANIFMLLSVATASQKRFGEKLKSFTVSSTTNFYTCLPLRISVRLTYVSCPPDATY